MPEPKPAPEQQASVSINTINSNYQPSSNPFQVSSTNDLQFALAAGFNTECWVYFQNPSFFGVTNPFKVYPPGGAPNRALNFGTTQGQGYAIVPANTPDPGNRPYTIKKGLGGP